MHQASFLASTAVRIDCVALSMPTADSHDPGMFGDVGGAGVVEELFVHLLVWPLTPNNAGDIAGGIGFPANRQAGQLDRAFVRLGNRMSSSMSGRNTPHLVTGRSPTL